MTEKFCCIHVDVGVASHDRWLKRKLLVLFTILVCFVALVQCFTGMDVLRWRSFYSTQDHAWKAHYSEIFDHGIREVLCCLGRSKYLYVSSSSSSLPPLSLGFSYMLTLLLLIFTSWCHVLGVSWKKMRSSQ